MPPRPSLQPASAIGFASRSSGAAPRHASMQPSHRPVCAFQQVRSIRYDTYADRKNKAKAWLGGEGKLYKRPLGAGRTNYLGSRRSEEGEFNLRRAAAGQEGAVPELSRDDGDEDPWEDLVAVEKLKKGFNVSDEQITSYVQRFEGLTPEVLSYVLSEGLELDNDAIRKAIKDRKTERANDQFDSEEIARSEATKRVAQGRAEEKKDNRKLDERQLRPFEQNRHFVTQPVLSEELREMIYLKVKRDGLTVRTVSALMGVSMERVGAVVRMKQMERDWVKQFKPLAVPYSKAILDMMPTTPYVESTDKSAFGKRPDRSGAQTQHESINDLPVHPYTTHQTFLSVPESRHFTRADAAAAFNPNLKPADARIPHTELLAIEKFKSTRPSALRMREFTRELMEKEKADIEALARREREAKDEGVKVYKGSRWNFRFQDVSVDDVGKDGRSRKGVGWRYGMPHEDRKRGQVKIPTSVS